MHPQQFVSYAALGAQIACKHPCGACASLAIKMFNSKFEWVPCQLGRDTPLTARLTALCASMDCTVISCTVSQAFPLH